MTTMTPILGDEFRRNVRKHLLFLCNGPHESTAVESFCQLPGGYSRIMTFLHQAGVSPNEASNFLNLSERTKSVFHRMKNRAVESQKK